MDGASNSPQKTLIRVRREIDDDLGSWGDGSRNLDIEHDFAVRSVGAPSRKIRSPIHTHGDYLRHGHSQPLKIEAQIVNGIAPTQLNNGNTLACAVGTCGEVIELGHLGGSV
jgi:hypothetical protein